DGHVGGDTGQYARAEHQTAEALPTDAQLSALGEGVLDMSLDLFDTFFLDHWADFGARHRAVTHLERTDALGKFVGKCVIDAALHQDAIGTDTGLAGIA